MDKLSNSDENRRVYIETFGCQMNILDSELLVEKLKIAGHSIVNNKLDANVLLYNTCSVRDLSEHKVLSRLGEAKQRKLEGEKLLVGVIGCMAERAASGLFKNNREIDLLVGPSKIDTVPQLLADLNGGLAPKRQMALSDFKNRKGKGSDLSVTEDLEMLDSLRQLPSDNAKGQAFVRITRGCNKFCSFCVVPRTRGPEAHRRPDAIIDEVKRLADAGMLEVTLLGQTINHYEFTDGGKTTSFADLLFRIHEEVPHVARLRFLTSHPRDFTDETLDVMATSARICHYLHIPAQSGSNRILKAMNRGYTVEEYLQLIERARSRMPNISIMSDMIVGFPTESEDDFAASLDLLRTVRYKNVFVFKYSPRPDTIAHKRFVDDVPIAEKKERNQRMLTLQNEIALAHHLSLVGQKLDVIVEGKAKNNPNARNGIELLDGSVRLTSRTRGDHIVAFDGPESLIGKMLTVEITGGTALALNGFIAK